MGPEAGGVGPGQNGLSSTYTKSVTVGIAAPHEDTQLATQVIVIVYYRTSVSKREGSSHEQRVRTFVISLVALVLAQLKAQGLMGSPGAAPPWLLIGPQDADHAIACARGASNSGRSIVADPFLGCG